MNLINTQPLTDAFSYYWQDINYLYEQDAITQF